MVLTPTVIVNGACDQFLPGSGLAKEQDGGITGSDRFDEFQHLPECRAVADDLIELQLAAYLLFKIQLLLGQLVFEFGNLPIR